MAVEMENVLNGKWLVIQQDGNQYEITLKYDSSSASFKGSGEVDIYDNRTDKTNTWKINYEIFLSKLEFVGIYQLRVCRKANIKDELNNVVVYNEIVHNIDTRVPPGFSEINLFTGKKWLKLAKIQSDFKSKRSKSKRSKSKRSNTKRSKSKRSNTKRSS